MKCAYVSLADDIAEGGFTSLKRSFWSDGPRGRHSGGERGSERLIHSVHRAIGQNGEAAFRAASLILCPVHLREAPTLTRRGRRPALCFDSPGDSPRGKSRGYSSARRAAADPPAEAKGSTPERLYGCWTLHVTVCPERTLLPPAVEIQEKRPFYGTQGECANWHIRCSILRAWRADATPSVLKSGDKDNSDG